MDHFLPEYATAAKIFVASAAICFGVAAAKLRYPSVETQIKRGDCPECKARKSLRTTPVDKHRVVFTCGECASQWLAESEDGNEIVIFGPANQPFLPKLHMTTNERTGDTVFTTDVGIAAFNLFDLDVQHRMGLLTTQTPRQMISFLYRAGVQPSKLDLTPDQKMKCLVAECTPYQWFAASAGVDIYYLMPSRADGLDGTTESTHD